MDESEDNMGSEDIKSTDSPLNSKTKPKKRSLIERELETNLTARITSPVSVNNGSNTSRYGRARCLKSQTEQSNAKLVSSDIKTPLPEKSPTKAQNQSPVYKMHASNTPQKGTKSPIKVVEKFLDNQIENIYQENKSLSRFGNKDNSPLTPSPSKKFPKVYIRKDLIQKREPEDTVMVIQNMFSPVKSAKKSTSTHLNNVLERSCERYTLNSKQQNGFIDNSSVVKTLDFDSKKKKKETKDKLLPSKGELFELEAKCPYQVGDLTWARMGTYPFWPSIVTRDPFNGQFVKKKLFGRIERDVIHVTFFGDNGRRSWIVDNMLRMYHGLLEFESARDNFTPQDKKKDPRLYAAYFISEKKQALWNTSVEEAEGLLKEPKRFRIDIFNDMLFKSRSSKIKQPKSKMSRTDSDVSLSESLYDSLFSEDDGKSDNNDKSKNRSRNKSLDMFEVVTACLDNMAAKTGITKIQRQSHMDIWLQKAKSKTPEKTKAQMQAPVKKLEEKKESKISNTKEKRNITVKHTVHKGYSLRKKVRASNDLSEDKKEQNRDNVAIDSNYTYNSGNKDIFTQEPDGLGIIIKVESLAGKTADNMKCPVDMNTMNTTCESETFTDESIDSSNINSTNNNTTDETMSEFDKPKSNHKSQYLDQNNLESTNKCKDIETGKNIVISEDSNKPANCNTDLDLNVIPAECLNKDKDQNSERQISIDISKDIDDANSENISNFEYPIKCQDPSNQDSIDLTNPYENLHPEKPKDIDLIEPSVNKKIKVNHNMGFQQSLSDAMDSKIQQHNEFQEHSDKINTITHKTSDNIDVSLHNMQDMQTQSSTINDSNIGNKELVSKYTENFESSTPNSKDKCLAILQDCIVRKDEIEVDNMSVDEDSDSERLPYSPLSNLGNNSDDNLSLDDVPFIEGNSNELESQEPDSENVNKSDDNTHLVNQKLVVKENLSTDNLESKLDTLEDESKGNENSLKQKTQLDKDLNGEIQCINGIIEKKPKEFEIMKETIPKCKKEVTTINVNAKEDIENTCNGYNGQNVRELNLKTKEVRIYVSDCVPPTSLKENGFHDITKELDAETASINPEDIVALSKLDSKRTLRSQKENKQDDPFNNPEFVKYMEFRQDAILDENPDLNENDIKAYLYKTWLYEQNVKSDEVKNDELKECNLVKGLNQAQSNVPPRKRHLALKKNQPSKTNTGTLKMFLRRKKDIELQDNNDEISFQKKRGIKKNMIKDDEDNDFVSNKNEWHILPVKEKNAIASSDGNKEINEIQNLSNGDIKDSVKDEELKMKDIDNPNASVELKDSGATQSNDKPEEITSIVTTTQNEIATTESSDNIKDSTAESKEKITLEDDLDRVLIKSEDSEEALMKCTLRSKTKADLQEEGVYNKIEDGDTISINSEESEASVSKRNKKLNNKKVDNAFDDPAFVKYLELRQDAVVDEHPELTHEDIVSYLYQTWLYEENIKSDIKKTDEIEQATMVKGLNDPVQQPKKIRRKVPKTEKDIEDDSPSKPKRKSVKPFYNEEYSDIEEELEVFEIFKPRKIKPEGETSIEPEPFQKEVEVYNEVELYFAELTKPKPNIFKGLLREKVCEICEKIGSLVKCKGCNGMFHTDCIKKQTEVVGVPVPAPKGRKKKKKLHKNKNFDEFDNDHDISEENNVSVEEILEVSHTVDADVFESHLSAKMQEMLNSNENIEYESYSSDDCLDWNETVPGKCEIVDIKLKPPALVNDNNDFKCNDCQKYDIPICFVCKGAISSKESTKRQNCNVAHCNKYYHLECLDHWPQTQFNGGEPSKNNKKFNEHFEAFTCPRHVCHTCVSDDPRGCKTRFSGDKLARCVRCPATYHSFTKCLPAGSQILTASHILCPRHHENRPGKAPCHVNTGWCFICALGGSLICCEYCPTSFHAECLNINPPEGGYMCEDCETGRLPLYGEMVWVKLGHYRWWPGIILHPYEIPENLLTVKHSPGEFVVRFFGQYDHYWVNRGRVFPFQEGDSGRISTNKSKIDAAFITAVEHAQRACEILKTAQPNPEESLDIASSLLPPHYVKLKVNKPCGSLCGRKLDDPESSLTQCECNPHDEDPCGPYSQCLNRMLLTECGPTCRAADRCNNRAFEKRLYPKLVPYRTPSRGWGLKTLEDIKAGQFVIEYVGELIDEEEFRRRMRRKHEMRDENFYFLTLDKERMIDAGPKGNLARFMNHCCEPNCETQKWTVLGDVRVGLFALYDIPAQSEVTFNYNLECAGIDKKRCMCGAKRCSGYIGAKPKQEESQSKKNRMHPTKRTYKKRKPEESPSTKNKSKRPIGRPPKPKELTEIEKDLLIIRNATSGLSSDESSRSLSSECDRHPKALKRKRISCDEEKLSNDVTASPEVKKSKLVDKLEGD